MSMAITVSALQFQKLLLAVQIGLLMLSKDSQNVRSVPDCLARVLLSGLLVYLGVAF